MFVGETGITRVIARTLEVMKELGSDDPRTVRNAGAIDLPLLQRYLNFWFSSSLDLFGAEDSSNAAMTFANGIKGRPDEAQFEDHRCTEGALAVEVPGSSGAATISPIPLRNAMNEAVRRAYVKDCEIGLKRWNRTLERAGVDSRLTLPSTRFRRQIGAWANRCIDPAGNAMAADLYQARIADWLPAEADRAFVRSLMQRVVEPGKIAGWIAPPERGINNLPVDYEYVRLN